LQNLPVSPRLRFHRPAGLCEGHEAEGKRARRAPTKIRDKARSMRMRLFAITPNPPRTYTNRPRFAIYGA
jgi:hypothetical protein